MRSRAPLLLAGIAAAVACGDDDAAAPVTCPDAGVVEAAAPVDAGPPPPQRAHVSSPELRTLLPTGNFLLLGVTTNFEPHAIYYQFNADGSTDVGAVPVYGGAPVILQKAIAEEDNAFVSGGAAAWYSRTVNGIASAISIWTPENGTKKVVTRTAAGVFAASRDGKRVAFSAGSDVDETPIVVTSSAAPTAEAPALSGANTVNLASPMTQCTTTLEFHAQTLFGAFCTGPAPDADESRLFTVGADGRAVLRADEKTLGSKSIVFFDADPLARHAFVFTGALTAHLLTVDRPDATDTKALGEVNDARLLDDGSGVVVLGAKGLSRVGDSDEVVLASDATILYGLTRDSQTVFYATTDPQAASTDLKDTSVSGSAPVTLVPTPTARFIDASGSSSHVIYRTDVAGGVGVLKAQPVRGGAELTLAPVAFGANVAPEGTSLLAVSHASSVSGAQAFRATFAYTDVTTAAPPLEMATALLTVDAGRWIDRSFVYQDEGTIPGLFALEVP